MQKDQTVWFCYINFFSSKIWKLRSKVSRSERVAWYPSDLFSKGRMTNEESICGVNCLSVGQDVLFEGWFVQYQVCRSNFPARDYLLKLQKWHSLWLKCSLCTVGDLCRIICSTTWHSVQRLLLGWYVSVAGIVAAPKAIGASLHEFGEAYSTAVLQLRCQGPRATQPLWAILTRGQIYVLLRMGAGSL